MPEIKNQFTGGKMNKDVDERLVPKGEYRDAMNIQVSTSEGSDVGTVQNILGNSAVVEDLGIDSGSICVGAIADEKNDALYWFMREPSTIPNQTVAQSRDIIFELKSGNVKHVFVDMRSVSIAVASLSTPASGDIVINSQAGFNAINVGDTFQLFANGTNLSGGEFYEVLSKDQGTLKINIGDYTNVSWANYQAGGPGELQIALNVGGNVLKFPSKIITGINIIDDMLFWTDGITEPKKINIPRSIAGTPSGNFHTRLINLDQNINYSSGVLAQEEHVTVIRKGPTKAPTVSNITSFREGEIFSYAIAVDLFNTNGSIPLSIGSQKWIAINDINGTGVSFQTGDVLRFSSNPQELAPEYFEIRASVLNVVDGPWSGGGITAASDQTAVKIEIESMSELGLSTSINPSITEWNVGLEQLGKALFERKLPRFSTRYKYEDNEYSTMGPFSEVVFIPGNFRYHPSEAYNTGMVNNLRELIIQDFIPNDIPKDVVQVDLLYKNEMSPNIYTIESITKNDTLVAGTNAWTSQGSAPGLFGSYKVSSENIYATLPSNQLLRTWDNVPRTALAQEVSGNRLIYGNYLQNYNLKFNGDNLIPNIQTTIGHRLEDEGNRGKKSIKSMRSYDVGIVWGDKYGRETPIITPSSGSTLVPKTKSARANSLNIEVDDKHPNWAEYYKIFIKETSNEYYNLAMDRVYNAEDGNIWISFPSIDRNKVDKDTYLILKKGIDTEDPVFDEGRYKIVAIENEAPEFIKTRFLLQTESTEDSTTVVHSHELWGGDDPTVTGFVELPDGGKDAPRVGVRGFTISANVWSGEWTPGSSSAVSQMGLPDLDKLMTDVVGGGDELWVSFSRKDDIPLEIDTHTRRYKIVQMKGDSDDPAVAHDFYEIKLHSPIFAEDAFITDDLYVGDDYVGVHFWKKSIENSPEFDGRFFVKILKDALAQEELINTQTTEGAWTSSGATTFYNITDASLTETSASSLYSTYQPLSSFPPFVSSGDTPTTNTNSTTRSENQWKNLLKFGTSTTQSNWFIDGASFAARQGDGTTVGDSNHNYKTGSHRKFWIAGNQIETADATSEQDYHYEGEVYNLDPTSSATTGWQSEDIPRDTGTGASLGVMGMKGAHDQGTSNYFDFSYSQINPAASNNKPNFTVGEDDINRVNSSTDQEQNVVSHFQPNQRFRIIGDDTIYLIISVQKFKLYNHQGFVAEEFSYTWENGIIPPTQEAYMQEVSGGGYMSVSDQRYNMRRASNRRSTYRIKYQVDEASLPDTNLSIAANNWTELLTDNTAFLEAQPNDGSQAAIEFISQYDADLPNVISNNPAIWETEPKEDVDLDIYYEATNNIPTKFTVANQESFIPIGATLKIDSSVAGVVPEGVFVTSWGGCDPITYDPNTGYCNPVDNVVNLSVPIDYTMYSALVQLPEVQFVRDDGSFTSAQVIGAAGISPSAPWTWTGLQISITNKIGLGWFNCWSFNNGVESNRIGDTYNKPFITNGVRVSSVIIGNYEEEQRINGLIYSGIYNSNSNTNELNQFVSAEKITKDINPIYGSIQKLHSRDSDLVTLCEDKCLKILANKDAVYNADGNPQLTANKNVLGQTVPFVGEFGISKNPESFASEAYRIYFTDKVRGTVMRLSMDGLTPISNHGMKDWFRDNLKLNNTILGSYDDKKDEYNVTLKQTNDAKRNNNPVTISFREDVKGWVSFKSFTPENAISCANEYYTFKDAKIWKHHDESVGRNTFYDAHPSSNWSTLNVILNDVPGSVKSFNTINYEGSQTKVETNFQDNQYYNLTSKPGWFVDSIFTNKESGSLNEFIEKEGKWFNYIRGEEVQHSGSNIIVNPDGSSSFDQASFAIQGLGILGAEPIDDPFIYGCMDPTAFNYNPSATASDNSCIPVIYGCMEETASNTCSNNCNTENGNCQWTGCCCQPQFFPNGCTNEDGFSEAFAYDAIWGAYSNQTLIVCDTTCIGIVEGCTDPLATNYDPLATVDDGSCIVPIYGCTFPSADSGYDITATDENGECIWYGCLDATAENYGTNFHADSDPGLYTPANSSFGQVHDVGTCTYTDGCMDELADNYDPNADNPLAGSCTYCEDWVENGTFGSPNYTIVITPETYQGYNDGTISIDIPSGTSPADFSGFYLLNDLGGFNGGNFFQPISASTTLPHVYTGLSAGDYYIQILQGSAAYVGDQTDPCEWNSYDGGTNLGMTVMPGPNPNGCIDATACNHDPLAIIDDSSCVYAGCGDPQATNFGNVGYQEGCGCTAGDTSCCTYAPLPVLGCTDDGSGTLVSAMYPGIAACNYDSNANTDDGSCTYTSCAGCLDDRQNNAQTGIAASNYDSTKTIHDQSQCLYNYDMFTVLSGPLAAHNFLGNNSSHPNWTDELIGSGVSGATKVSAVFDVSNAPPIRFPGYNAAGVYAPSQTSTRETQFSWEMPGHTSDWSSGVAGDITAYYGFSTTSPIIEWAYSNDNGATWLDGPTNYVYGSEVRLVKFYMYVSDDESSGRLDWGTYPNGYDGIIKQNAKFGFTDVVWNGNPIPLNDDGACASNNSCPDLHVIETSQTNTIKTGCIHAGYCNTSGYGSNPPNANWPTDATNNPCAGTPGCNIQAACNYSPAADCNDGSCTTPTTWYYHSSNWTCGTSAPASGCFGLNVCQVNGTCRGTAYISSSHCETANCTGLVGCTDPTACNYNSAAVCDDGNQCLQSIQCPDQADSGTGYNCGSSGCYQPDACGLDPNGTFVGCGTYTGASAASDCAANCTSSGN